MSVLAGSSVTSDCSLGEILGVLGPGLMGLLPREASKALWRVASCWTVPLPLGCLPAWPLRTSLQAHLKQHKYQSTSQLHPLRH